MNSFIPWIGGKKLLRKQIIELFPKDAPSRYIEVFGGAGWVLFGKDIESKQLEVFNDINSDLINLYRCIKYHASEVQKELDWLLSSREIFFQYKDTFNESSLTDIQRAVRYLYIVKVSFGADKKSFGTYTKNIQNTKKLLLEIQERLSKVVIENKAYENLIKTYDRKDALFYLDPPYHNTEHYYADKFTTEDHHKLCEILKNVKGKFILSYNNDPFIKSLYADFNIYEVSRANNLKIDNNSIFKEVIITNFK